MTTTPQEPSPDHVDEPILNDRAEAEALKTGDADDEPAEQDDSA